MKYSNIIRIFIVLAFALGQSISSFCQRKEVKFEMNSAGMVVRPNSSQNFYVFTYEGLSAYELMKRITTQWQRWTFLPERELSNFRGSTFDSDYETKIIISGTYPRQTGGNAPDGKNLILGDIHTIICDSYVFVFQFKDGKIRVDPPIVKGPKSDGPFIMIYINKMINQILDFYTPPTMEWKVDSPFCNKELYSRLLLNADGSFSLDRQSRKTSLVCELKSNGKIKTPDDAWSYFIHFVNQIPDFQKENNKIYFDGRDNTVYLSSKSPWEERYVYGDVMLNRLGKGLHGPSLARLTFITPYLYDSGVIKIYAPIIEKIERYNFKDHRWETDDYRTPLLQLMYDCNLVKYDKSRGYYFNQEKKQEGLQRLESVLQHCMFDVFIQAQQQLDKEQKQIEDFQSW